MSTLTTTTKVRKNDPIASTAYLRISVAQTGTAAIAAGFGSLVTVSVICLPP
jgi:hypothetical protein